jgi:methyl-accepting chemotaxis protein
VCEIGIKNLRKELSEMNKSMERMAEEIHETSVAIRESLKLTSDSIREMSENFSKTLEETLKIMQDMRIQMDIKDSILKTLGIDGMIPDFFKKKK